MKAEKKEVNAIVLDVLMKGHVDDPRPQFKREPIVPVSYTHLTLPTNREV